VLFCKPPRFRSDSSSVWIRPESCKSIGIPLDRGRGRGRIYSSLCEAVGIVAGLVGLLATSPGAFYILLWVSLSSCAASCYSVHASSLNGKRVACDIPRTFESRTSKVGCTALPGALSLLCWSNSPRPDDVSAWISVILHSKVKRLPGFASCSPPSNASQIPQKMQPP
jgi:hypothetical protein